MDEVSRRLFLPMLLEATRALEELLVEHPAVIDTALCDGLGMTELYRGLFGWADAVGPPTILDWLEPYQPLGPRFQPTPLLLKKAADRTTFLA